MYDILFLQPRQVAERRAVFNALVADGLDRTVFYNCTSPRFEDFEAVAGDGAGWCMPVYRPESECGALAAVGWLNSFMGRAAFCHFCVLRDYMPKAVDIGKQWCRTVLATGRFDCLLGLTPATYRHALHFIQHIGFELSPLRASGACYIARQRRYVDGVYSRLMEVK